NLDHAKSRLARPPRCFSKCGDHVLDAVDREFMRMRIRVGEGNWAGRDHIRPSSFTLWDSAVSLPRAVRACLAPGMRQLHARDRTLFIDKSDNSGQWFDVRIAPDPEVLRADSAFRRDRRCFGED